MPFLSAMRGPSHLGLRTIQWLIRGIQLACAVVILAIYSYILATLTNHKLPIPYAVRVVEGISGFAILYSLCALLLLCCLAGHVVTSFLALLLDLAFVGAFIYVAVANKTGASSCSGGGGGGGGELDTPFGKGKAGDTTKDGRKGFTNLPTFGSACKLQSACLAVAVIAIFFYIFSAAIEVALGRSRQKDKRHLARSSFAEKNDDNNNNLFTGSGGFFSRLFKHLGTNTVSHEENALPEHTLPHQLDDSHGDDYMTETARLHRHGSTYQPVQLDHDHHSYNRYDGAHGEQPQQSGVTYDDSTPYGRISLHQPYASSFRSPTPHIYDDGVDDRV